MPCRFVNCAAVNTELDTAPEYKEEEAFKKRKTNGSTC